MLERATRTIKTAGLLLAAYFVLNIVLRIALPHSLELDEAEQSFFSQYLLAGYGPQPPFYNWMQYAVVSVTGMSIGALLSRRTSSCSCPISSMALPGSAC